MANIKTSVEQLIGNTPLLELVNYEKKYDLKARILLKVESVNILGSLKDRIAVAMIDALERDTDIKKGDYIVESSSGNTAIALAAIARKRGYKFLTVVAGMTKERYDLLRAYGAEILDLADNPDLAADFANIAEDYRLHDLLRAYFKKRGDGDGNKYYLLAQWANEANRNIQYSTTGQEIIRDTDGKVDVFVAGAGSGGSISGISKALREVNPDLEVVLFDPPADDPDSLDGVHHVTDMPYYFLPTFFDGVKFYDKYETVTKEDAYRASNKVAIAEGAFFGVSTGAAVHLATQLAKKPEYEGKTIVAIAYDDVLKYLSTDLINPKYQED